MTCNAAGELLPSDDFQWAAGEEGDNASSPAGLAQCDGVEELETLAAADTAELQREWSQLTRK